MRGKLDQHDKRFDETRCYVTDRLGLGSMNDLRLGGHAAPMDAGEAEGRRVEGRLSDPARLRVGVEEWIDG